MILHAAKIKICMLALVVLCLAAFKLSTHPYESKCQDEHKTMAGWRYIVNVCIIGRHEDQTEFLRLQVFSEHRELLVDRKYEIVSGQESPFYEGSAIIYFDVNEDDARQINFPPSRWEWLRARLP